MTILVTGATGFVGAAIARNLLSKGIPVRVLVRPLVSPAKADRSNLTGLKLEIAEGDLNDAQSLSAALQGCEGLFHVAADYRLWTRNPAEMLDTNIEGTRNIMRAALDTGVKRIVYTSSVATLRLGNGDTPVDESSVATVADMTGPYKQSKYLAEAVVADMIHSDNLPAVIVNPSTPVGPGDVKPTPTGRMIAQAAAGKMPAFVETGLNIVHVDDVAEGHILAYDRGVIGERYILGGENLTLGEILGEIAAITGKRPPTLSLPHNLVMPIAALAELWARISGGEEPFATRDGIRMARKKMFFSSNKAETDLGYSARPAEEALRDAVEWFQTRSG